MLLIGRKQQEAGKNWIMIFVVCIPYEPSVGL
jgi:hypothetical protein